MYYIVRPKTGFEVSIKFESDQKRVEEFRKESPASARVWDGLIDRLKMSAHKEGDFVPEIGDDCKVLIISPDVEAGTPRILVAYRVFLDQVSIRLVVI